MSIFLNEFGSKEDLASHFDIELTELDGCNILLAWYGSGSYDGSAFVLYEKDGKLYEVHGSHCSCSGLEGQWSPEETSWEALKMRDLGDYEDGASDAQKALQALVDAHLPPTDVPPTVN